MVVAYSNGYADATSNGTMFQLLPNDSKGNMHCNAIFLFDETYYRERNKRFWKSK